MLKQGVVSLKHGNVCIRLVASTFAQNDTERRIMVNKKAIGYSA